MKNFYKFSLNKSWVFHFTLAINHDFALYCLIIPIKNGIINASKNFMCAWVCLCSIQGPRKDFCTVRCVSNPSVRRFELHGVRPVFWLSVPGSLVRWLQLSVCWQFELPRKSRYKMSIFSWFCKTNWKINYIFFLKVGMLYNFDLMHFARFPLLQVLPLVKPPYLRTENQ